jgi:hypothetical protein
MKKSSTGVPKYFQLVCHRNKLAAITENNRTRTSATKRPIHNDEKCLVTLSFTRFSSPDLPDLGDSSQWTVTFTHLEHISDVCFTYDSRRDEPAVAALPIAEAALAMATAMRTCNVPLRKAATALNYLGGPRYTPARVASFFQGRADTPSEETDLQKVFREIDACQKEDGFADVILVGELAPGQRGPDYVQPDGGDVRAIIWATRQQLVYARAFGYQLSVDAQAVVCKYACSCACAPSDSPA